MNKPYNVHLTFKDTNNEIIRNVVKIIGHGKFIELKCSRPYGHIIQTFIPNSFKPEFSIVD